MQRHFQRNVDLLHQRLLAMSGIVEQMIDKATRSLVHQKHRLAEEVMDRDEEVNEAEVLIEEECLKILALHQPVASDLRRIATVMKINVSLERIADLACNIAERAQCLQSHPYFPIPEELEEMVTLAKHMVQMSLDSFVKFDSTLALRVIQTDPDVDQLNRTVIAELKMLMQQDSTLIEPALHCFSAARHIERIGDQAENIAEDVIYIVDGDIIRHKHGDFTSLSRESLPANRETKDNKS